MMRGNQSARDCVSDRLNRKLDPYRKYLEGLGFNGARDVIPFYSGSREFDENGKDLYLDEALKVLAKK